MDEPLSLQQLIDSSERPALVLDFRLKHNLETPSLATIKDLKVSHNPACEHGWYSEAFKDLLEQNLEKLEERGNRVQGPQEHERPRHYNVAGDAWLSVTVGCYHILTLEPSKAAASSLYPEVVSSREDHLYRRLNSTQGPLESFSELSDQALKDAEAVRKDVSQLSSETQLDTQLAERISGRLLQLELNLRTVSSGISLLKDLSDVSDLAPPRQRPESCPAVRLPDKDLLTSIRDRVYAGRVPQSTSQPLWPAAANYKHPSGLEAYAPSLRLLIVEDNIVNQKLLQKICQKYGTLEEFITQALDGAQALEMIEQMTRMGHFPDLIFVDCSMPVLDGYSFLEEFRRRWPNAKCRIVGMTAHAMIGFDKRFKELGAHEVLTKPIKWMHLSGQLELATRLKMSREVEFRGKL
ncbi:hypothetical protein H072_2367 [Dactylellina haptotyla CBS 200.50]|uniref:Response regulatory domain-containing protein n=1 Tax=Dactylellina haptotyla (strain CBS 200.50) TaxID=1284197 RepID=S8AL00_DACHA|nr:hypothetical protein H072_2367 [Dactylellina haptotyla CBS 200.50]